MCKKSKSEHRWARQVTFSGRNGLKIVVARHFSHARVMRAVRFVFRLALMTFSEDIVLPAFHAKQNLANDRHVMNVMGVDGHFTRNASW